jgi:hypothetical protein
VSIGLAGTLVITRWPIFEAVSGPEKAGETMVFKRIQGEIELTPYSGIF